MLLLDLGNTAIKYAYVEDQGSWHMQSVLHRPLKSALAEIAHVHPVVSSIYVASVLSDAIQNQLNGCCQQL